MNLDEQVFLPSEVGEMIKKCNLSPKRIRKNKNSSQMETYEVSASFDIETSSWYEGEEKRACMYAWSFTIGSETMIGRTWDSFKMVLRYIKNTLGLSSKRVFVIYIHNEAYEFQWFRNWFEWEDVFAIDERKPIRAVTKDGIEFRCSLALSGYALKNLPTKRYKKLVGDLDYSKIRTSATPLTDEEWFYVIYDTKKVVEYIDEQRAIYGGIENIPHTKTGKVRRYCRDTCLPKDNFNTFKLYSNIMKTCKISSIDEYKQAKRAFAGGFTHASWRKSGKVLYNVGSFDLCSDYPATMVGCKFPMGRGSSYVPKSEEDFLEQLNNYCCLFDIHFVGLESKEIGDHPLSFSRCTLDSIQMENGRTRNARISLDNGRIIKCDGLTTTLTELDFFTMRDFYKWEYYEIYNFRRYYKGYLPTPFVESILTFYKNKTELKGVEGSETEYMLSKENANSCYGMTVTDILRECYEYINNEWITVPSKGQEDLEKYNNDSRRFLSYMWGIWVTAHARRRLFKAIKYAGDDYCYSDTDSVKVTNPSEFMKFIEEENLLFRKQLIDACNYHGFDISVTEPKTKDGVSKPLGAWEYEGVYEKFKTLGAKRYMFKKNNALKIENKKYNVSLTVSGVNKEKAIPYLLNKYGEDAIFDEFDDGLVIPREYTGKNTLTYIDELTEGTVIDYLGNRGTYYEKSSIHMEGSEYSLSLDTDYLALIKRFMIGIGDGIN